LTFGAGSLWLAANGSGERWRSARPTDAAQGAGEVFRVDPATGRTVRRYPVPGGGGVHGIDFDPFDEGMLWVTTLKRKTLTQMRIEDWTELRSLPLPYSHAHGVVRVEDGIWVVHKMDWVIVKLDLRDGSVRDRIEIPRDHPELHCLSACGAGFLYCDATSGWVVRIAL
jgi:streptogramin lyase